MKLKGTRYDVSGKQTEVEIDNARYVVTARIALGSAPDDRRMNVNSCYPRTSPTVMFLCDDDAVKKKLPLNSKGTELYGAEVFGPIVVFDKKAFLEFDRDME